MFLSNLINPNKSIKVYNLIIQSNRIRRNLNQYESLTLHESLNSNLDFSISDNLYEIQNVYSITCERHNTFQRHK